MEIMEKNAKDESKQKHFLHKTHRLLSENDVENEQALWKFNDIILDSITYYKLILILKSYKNGNIWIQI